MLTELKHALEEVEKGIKQSRDGFRTGWNSLHSADEQYKKAEQLRMQLLQSALEEKGLAFCSVAHADEGQTAEQLGIFPLNQMRLQFHREGPYRVQGEYDDSYRTDVRLELLCPSHFPKERKWQNVALRGYSLIDSEVVKENNRFLLVVDGSDITRLVQKGGSDINPSGRPLHLVGNSGYRHFGIPDLPKKPEFEDL